MTGRGWVRRRVRQSVRRRSLLALVVAVALVAGCGSYDRNPPTARPTAPSRPPTTTRPVPTTTAAVTTTRPAVTTTTPAGATTTTAPPTGSVAPRPPSTTIATLDPSALPPLRGRLAIDDGTGRVVVAAPNGTAGVIAIDAPGASVGTPVWSPDASRLAVVTGAGGQSSLVVAGATGGNSTATPSNPGALALAWSPTAGAGGPLLALRPAATDRVELVVTDAAATAPRVLAQGVSLGWSLAPDGRRAVVLVDGERLVVTDLATGASTPVPLTPGSFRTPVWLVGNDVLVARREGTRQLLSRVDVVNGRRTDLLAFDGTITFVVDGVRRHVAYQVVAADGGPSPASWPDGGDGGGVAATPVQLGGDPVPVAPLGRLSTYDLVSGTNRSIADSVAAEMTWSDTGDLLAARFAQGDRSVWRFWDGVRFTTSVPHTPPPVSEEAAALPFEQLDQAVRRFSPDALGFVFAGRVGGLDGIWVQPLDRTGPPARVAAGVEAWWSPR